VILIIAALSLLQATLTLPGIAGIVLTIGMAVDANVLIYERIREELKQGNTPQTAIHAGFERAFATILDSNITTLIAAVLLFLLGSGPVKGFAVTLTIGILTTIFTAVTFSRAIINYFYGGRRLEQLSV
jgi:preprotein translocase subunit SecD